jgi:hypothetical protein
MWKIFPHSLDLRGETSKPRQILVSTHNNVKTQESADQCLAGEVTAL